MSRERETIHQERLALKRKYGALFSTVSSLLFEADPVGINFGHNTDEYEPEVGTILPRLEHATTTQEVAEIVHEEFCRWFGAEEAGTPKDYEALSAKILEAWLAFVRHDV